MPVKRWVRLGMAKSHFVEWNGKPISSVKTGFGSAVRLAGLDVAAGNVTPHTLRHTAATWLMQRAAPMWEAAGFLGMSEKIRALFRVSADSAGNLPPMPSVFPDWEAPVIRNHDSGRELVKMRWGLPNPEHGGINTNIRQPMYAEW